MFGVGPQEMMIIAVAALLIFGPGRLPEVMGEAGRQYRKFREMTNELSGEFEKTVAEARSEFDGVMGELGPMQKQVSSISKSVQKDLGGSGKTTSTGKKASTSTKASTTSKSNTSSTSKTTSTKKTTSTSGSKTTSKPTDSRAQSTTTSSKAQAVASKEDPYADFGIFEVADKPTRRRARSATPSAISDLTPRIDETQDRSEPVSVPSAGTSGDDPLARARARRRSAGYARS